MQCNEVKEHLHAYADGELEPSLHESVRDSLSDCPECQEELAEIVALQSLAREAFETPVEAVDFSGFADAVMTRIGEENAIEGVKVERSSEEPSLLSRLSSWFGELFALERPVAAFAAMALIVGLVTTAYIAGKDSPGTPAQNNDAPQLAKPNTPQTNGSDKPMVAKDDKSSTTRRRAPEREHFDRRNTAILESHRVAGGRIFIEKDDASDRPAVVWHVDSEPTQGGKPAQPLDSPSSEDGESVPN